MEWRADKHCDQPDASSEPMTPPARIDSRITELVATGKGALRISRPHIEGAFVARVECTAVSYRGEGPTLQAALDRLAEDVWALNPTMGDRVAVFASLVAGGQDQDVAAWMAEGVF